MKQTSNIYIIVKNRNLQQNAFYVMTVYLVFMLKMKMN